MNKEEVLNNLEQVKEWIKEKDELIEKIEGNYTWYLDENKDVDTSKIKNVGGYLDAQGCPFDFSSLKEVGSSLDAGGSSSDFGSLKKVGGDLYVRGCYSGFSGLEEVGGSLHIQGCYSDFKKKLAKTLKKCDDIYVEFHKPMTLKEFKKYAKEL